MAYKLAKSLNFADSQEEENTNNKKNLMAENEASNLSLANPQEKENINNKKNLMAENEAKSLSFANLQEEENTNNKKKTFKLYKTNEKNGGMFDLRFEEMKGSLVDQNLFYTLGSLASWKVSSFFKKDLSWPNANELEQSLPMEKPKFPTFDNKIVYTWIGHSTAVISLGKDINILIDPVFLDRCSPNQIMGPKRFQKPACELDDLPEIDLVLVSHDHYDHLETDALEKLFKRNDPIFIAGLESKDVFPKGCNLHELNWTQDITLSKKENGKLQKVQNCEFDEIFIKVTFVPACHYGRRGATDMCKRLWGGFVIEAKDKKIFYSGDTGMCGVFEEIGEQFNGFDLSILPIGAYEPRKLLKCQHVNPEESVEIHKQIKSKKSVGVHWGTFPLGDEKFDQARSDLKDAALKSGLEEEFITVNHGGHLEVDF